MIIRSISTYTTNIYINKNENGKLFEKMVGSSTENRTEGREFIKRWIKRNKKHLVPTTSNTEIYEYTVEKEREFIILSITWYIGEMREKRMRVRDIRLKKRREQREYRKILVSGILFYQRESIYTEQELKEKTVPILEKIYDEEFFKNKNA